MTPLHDLLPEERWEPQATLITLLQRAYSASVAVPPDRQAQIIARVQERLLKTASETPLNQTMPGPLNGAMNSSPGTAVSLIASPRRRGRLIRLSTLLAAVLVIGAIVGTSLLISLSRPQITGAPPIGPVGTPVTNHTQAGGLEATMQIIPGPYFLGEVLAADLSLTNHTHSAFLLLLIRTLSGNPCNGDLGIMLTGGDSPHYTAPWAEVPGLPGFMRYLNNCDPGWVGMPTQLEPGHTITVHQYLVLTDSGHVTLSAGGTFYTLVLRENAMNPTSGPLDRHWPSLHIDVEPQVPPDRMLSLKRQGEQVFVIAPLDVRSHLVYKSLLNCQYGNGSSSSVGYNNWTPLSTTVLHEVPCPVDNTNGTNFPGKFVRWIYAVSAPGYAIAWGHVPS